MLTTWLDNGLVALAAATVALILWKVWELYLPGVIGRVRLVDAVKSPRELDEAMERLEGGMTVLGSIASAAPFIGLAATVLHIMAALSHLSGQADVSLLAGPIATALRSTLLGLASAVPAAIAYNIMARRIQVLENRARRALPDAAGAAA